MPRFVLLEHTGHPDDPRGLHYDLLLEDVELAGGPACRTWRLDAIPVVGGADVPTRELPPHRLEWLDRLAGPVSGDRGFARRIDAGTYERATPTADRSASDAAVVVNLAGDVLSGRLRIAAEPNGSAVLVRA